MPTYDKPTGPSVSPASRQTASQAQPTAAGSPIPSGAGRPAGAINTKSVIRYEQIARYRVAGRMSDQKIADMVGLTPQALALAIKTPTYKEIEDGLLEGRLTQIDEQLAGEDEQIRDLASAAVPAALRALIDGVTQRRDLRSALVAAKTILQFDPNKTLTEQGKAPALGDGSSGGPQLPENVIAYLSLQGNKVVAEIRTSSHPSVSVSGEGLDSTANEVGDCDGKADVIAQAQRPPIPLILQEEGEA